MGVRIGTLSEWNRIFDEKMLPLIVPDGRGKNRKITPDMVKQIVEMAKERKSKGRRIRLKSFTKQLTTEKDIVHAGLMHAIVALGKLTGTKEYLTMLIIYQALNSPM